MKKVKKKEGCAKQCLASSQVYSQVYRGYGELFPRVLSSHSLVQLRLSSIEEPCVLKEYSSSFLFRFKTLYTPDRKSVSVHRSYTKWEVRSVLISPTHG